MKKRTKTPLFSKITIQSIVGISKQYFFDLNPQRINLNRIFKNTLQSFFLFLFLQTTSYGLTSEWNNKSKEGWFFYQDPKKEEEIKEKFINKKNIIKRPKNEFYEDLTDEEFIKQLPADFSTLTAYEFRQSFSRMKDIAIQKPTPTNVILLQSMNNYMSNQANLFALNTSRALLDNPLQDSTNIANTNFAKNITKADIAKNIDEGFAKLNEEGLNIVVFFKDYELDQISKYKTVLENKYNIQIHYIDVSNNQEIQEKYNMKIFPEIFATTKTQIKHIGSGAITQDLLLKNIQLQFPSYFNTNDSNIINRFLQKDKQWKKYY